jgi:hypothetical protein
MSIVSVVRGPVYVLHDVLASTTVNMIRSWTAHLRAPAYHQSMLNRPMKPATQMA